MRPNRRQFIRGAASMMALPLGQARAASAETMVLGGDAFGTYWRGTFPTDADAVAVSAVVGSVVESVDLSMSPFRVDSEITRFNQQRLPKDVDASADFCAVAGEALRVARLSGGAFEPTVGPLVHRFGFGPIIGETGTYKGIDVADGRIGKAEARLTLDLCGIAKGFALDRIVESLARSGLKDFLVELGGEVKASGEHPAGRPWQIGIQRPGEPMLAFQRLVRLDELALATSGTTINGLAYRGHGYSHIIDPRSGSPVNNGVASVSVLAPTAMEADALATALMVMGPEDGGRLAESAGRPALFLAQAVDGLRETMVAGFASHVLT